MLQALWNVLFVRQFYGLSRHFWEDDEGVVHEIDQSEGGVQGDPFVFSSGQHVALTAAIATWRVGFRYVITTPDRV